jgi:hypothetical protein
VGPIIRAPIFSSPAGPLAVGSAIGSTGNWTEFSDSFNLCGTLLRLLCFETTYETQVQPTPDPNARLAFVTQGDLTMPGLSNADGLCDMEANNGHTFRALLATSSGSAASRVTHPGPWKRLDGVQVSTDLTRLDAPINETAGDRR